LSRKRKYHFYTIDSTGNKIKEYAVSVIDMFGK